MDLKTITDHYHERMQRILLFEPLYRLERKELKTVDGQSVSGMGLGLLSLLFFFENMLFNKQAVGIQELAAFLQLMTKAALADDMVGYEKIARDIVAVFRPSTGRRNEQKFFNWGTRQADSVQYSILKANRADIGSNTQYYVLDEQGLELIFATKEYFSEFQLSINQLILRKQLEKGEFALAIRQIEEMQLDVHALQERMNKIANEVHRNIISEETLLRYKKIIADINLRLEREEQEFRELKEFVKNTRVKIGDNIINDLVRQAYENILTVDKQLGIVHAAHRSLLKITIDLKTAALNAAAEALYFTGVELFNFQQEITKKLFAAPLPLYTARNLVEPFLHLQRNVSWSPLTVFAGQRLDEDNKAGAQSVFPEVMAKSLEQRSLANLQANYLKIMKLIFTLMGARRQITLAAVIAALRDSSDAALLDSKQFYLFWIFLHRKSPVNFVAKEISAKSAFYQMIMDMPYVRSVNVVELPEIIMVNEKYRISDMQLSVEAE